MQCLFRDLLVSRRLFGLQQSHLEVKLSPSAILMSILFAGKETIVREMVLAR